MLLNAGSHLRNWGAKVNAAIIFTSLGAALVVAAFVTAFVVGPQALGWVGFTVVSAVLVGLGAVATLVLPRMRVSAPRPTTTADANCRPLVGAAATCSAAGLGNEIQARRSRLVVDGVLPTQLRGTVLATSLALGRVRARDRVRSERGSMVAALTVVIAVALAPAAEAGGPFMMVGAADDILLKENAADAATQVEKAQQAGLDTLRLTAQWTRGQTALPSGTAGALETAVVAAKAAGVRIVLSLYPYGSSQTPLTQASRADFAAWSGDAVTLLPSVHDFVVGNEPNLNRFWLPQYGPAGENVAAPAYVALLAQTYDAIKAIRPRTTIYGGALAPRGSDRAGTIRDTHSPTQFILDMGAAYRASGRTKPIMDAFALHPYADASNVPPSLAHPNSTSIGIADYPKLVALLGQAFDGTAQRGSALPILYAEFGVESQIPAAKAHFYAGTEPATVHPVGEAIQGAFYEQALQLTFCQPTVMGLLLFHYIDERARAGWQSGLYYVDGTPKTSLARVRGAADSTRRGVVARCPALRLTPKLTIATAVKPRLRVTLTSSLDARYTLRLQRIGGKTPRLVLEGTLVGRTSTTVPVSAKLAPGRYRWLARTTAAQNAGPIRSATSRTFTIR